MDFKAGEVLFFDKPLTWTSFALVNKVRYHLCRRIGVKKLKVGHAGTLDPLATGVMIVCTGKATKRIEEFQYHTKEYVATLMLGATTPSYDLEKEIDATYPTEHITRELVEETLYETTNTYRKLANITLDKSSGEMVLSDVDYTSDRDIRGYFNEAQRLFELYQECIGNRSIETMADKYISRLHATDE